jgi:hypothetical protein
MNSRHYSLAPGDPPRLELVWGNHYRYLYVRLDGRSISKINNAGELLRGAQVILPDGGVLLIKLLKGEGKSDLRVTLNGTILKPPGLATDTRDLLEAYQAVIGIALLNLLTFFFTLDDTSEFAAARWYTISFAAAFFLLGWLVKSGSGVALTFAIVMYFVEAFFTILSILSYGAYGAIPFLFVRLFLLYIMVRGYGSWERARESFRFFTRMITDPKPAAANTKPQIAPATAPVPFSDPDDDPFGDPFAEEMARAAARRVPLSMLPPNARQVHDLLQQGVALYNSGQHLSQARQMIKEAVRLAPTLAEGWYVVAYVVEKREDRLRALERAIGYDPLHSGAQVALERMRRGQAFVERMTQ